MDQLQTLVLDPLKPYLLPITQNIPGPVDDFIVSLLGQPCHDALLLDVDFAGHPQCVSLGISKALGIGIIAAASIVKVPQIVKLVKSGSAEGLSFTSYLLETASFIISLSYNIRNKFPFSTYGETSLIAIQDVVICVLILVFTEKGPQGRAEAAAFLAAMGSAVYALMISDTLITNEQMTNAQAGAGLLAIASKVPQILAIYQQGGTGQLSAFAVFNYLVGSLSRIYTTLQEVDDKLILYGFVAGFVLNAILAAQVIYYWNSPASTSKAGEKGKVLAIEEEDDVDASATTTGASPGRPNSSSGRRRA